jgi:hypothetical protein
MDRRQAEQIGRLLKVPTAQMTSSLPSFSSSSDCARGAEGSRP